MNKNIFLFALILLCHNCFSQTKTNANNETKKTIKIKPPHLTTSMGVLKDSISSAPLDQVKALLGAPLKVTDDKNNSLTITYYQFYYKSKAIVQDEKTGKYSQTSSLAADYFTSTPIPEKWAKIIRDDLIAGEELYFFDIIVKDKEGHIFYAPNFKIITK
jgi:hypothetical protein